MKRGVLFFLMLWFCYSLLRAQSHSIGSPKITNFTKSDYHGGTQNWALLQDPRGVVYSGNNEGLLEFDGSNWHTHFLPNRTIARSMALDAKGRFYLGGQDEFGHLTTDASGRIQFSSLTHLIPKNFKSFEDVWEIFPMPDGIFFCTQRAIFKLNGEKIQVIQPETRFDYFFELKGKLYVQDSRKRLLIWSGDQLQPIPQSNDFSRVEIAAILPFDAEQRLIVSVANGLYLMNDKEIRPWNTATTPFLREFRAYCAIQLADGRYAIGSPHNGLLIMNREGQPQLHLNTSTGLQNNTILCIMQDQAQNLWLGLDNGIDYVEISSPFSMIRSEEGLEGTGYASILYQSNLYLGTNQGLHYINWTKDIDPLNPPRLRLVNNGKGQVWSINNLDDELLIGHHEGAFYLRNNQAIPIQGIKGVWKFLKLNRHPNFAIAGTYTGLYLFEKQTAGATQPAWKIVRKLEGFDESARVFEEDTEGNIWVSHAYKGLYKIKLKDTPWAIEAVSFYNTDHGLPTDLFINVCKIRGELVFTTPMGTYSYDQASNQFHKHQELEEVFGEYRSIQRLLEDENGDIWFSADDKFGVLKIREKGIVNKLDKLYFNHIQEDLVDGFEHVYALDANDVFIATEKGFIHYQPSQAPENQSVLKVLIRKVEVIGNQDTVVWGGGLANQDTVALQQKRPAFPNKMNAFRFGFSIPHFQDASYVQYRYQLEGFDENWSDWTEQTEKEYTNLPHNTYTFRVEARNSDLQISETATYTFTISPPWYLTAWAKGAYFITGILLLLTLLQSISKRIEKQKEILRQEQEKTLERKEAEYRQQKEKSEAEIIRLRNEKLKADINHKNQELASATMHLVQKGEILHKLKNDLKKLADNAPGENQKKIRHLIKNIDENIELDENWEQFEVHFDQVHENFLKQLREQYPALTPKDQKLCAYLRMNLSTKEIAPLMNISVRGVEISRYRLRKKLDIDTDTNLVDFLMKI